MNNLVNMFRYVTRPRSVPWQGVSGMSPYAPTAASRISATATVPQMVSSLPLSVRTTIQRGVAWLGNIYFFDQYKDNHQTLYQNKSTTLFVQKTFSF